VLRGDVGGQQRRRALAAGAVDREHGDHARLGVGGNESDRLARRHRRQRRTVTDQRRSRCGGDEELAAVHSHDYASRAAGGPSDAISVVVIG
jgi:hypothetical protein